MRLNNWPAWWKFLVSLQMQSLKMPQGKKCSLVNIYVSCNKYWIFLTMIKARDHQNQTLPMFSWNQVQYGLWHLTYFIVSSDSNNSPRIVANSWGKKHWPGTKDISVAIGCNDPTFVNFLEGCLRWDKNQRSSPDELMQHSWIVGVSISLLDLNSTNP